jgi:hypothetical protein
MKTNVETPVRQFKKGGEMLGIRGQSKTVVVRILNLILPLRILVPYNLAHICRKFAQNINTSR